MTQSVVAAQNFAGRRNDVAGIVRQFASLLLQISLDKLYVIAGGHKANFLAFRLFRHRHLQAARDFAHFVLGKFAQRKIGARELFLRKSEKKIALVLRFIHGPQQFVAARFRIVAYARVVAGGDALGANLARGHQQLIELHVVIAHGARNRRAAFEIIVHERLNHVQFELALEIHDVERNAQMLGHAARVVDIVVRAAAVLRGPPAFCNCGRRR